MSKWYEYISVFPKWKYVENSFECGGNGYLTDIVLSNGYAGSAINSITFTCSNGTTKEFSNGGFQGPKIYTISEPTGISNITIGHGENQVGIDDPAVGLTGNWPVVSQFYCPPGSYINRVDVKIPYTTKIGNFVLAGRLDYIGGFRFGCTTPEVTNQPKIVTSQAYYKPPTTTKSQSKSTTTTKSSSHSDVGLIVGIIIALIVTIIAIIAGIYFYRKHKKAKKAQPAV